MEMQKSHEEAVEDSRDVLLRAIGEPDDLTFIRLYGNIGDELIYAGTRQLLARRLYKEVSVRNLSGVSGHTALVAGGGCWCGPYHDMVKHLPVIETKFERVIIMPSSFDVSIPSIRSTLAATKALVFARERESFDGICRLCDAKLTHDCAFFFDYRPYLRCGEGCLVSYRIDRESVLSEIPENNQDISRSCSSLDEWLWTIARHAVVRTDRAHVMIAAALVGKVVEYWTSSYHKVPAIADYALKPFPVQRSEPQKRIHPSSSEDLSNYDDSQREACMHGQLLAEQ
jgi:exopolysaccharide biosynthesis predicted pyruvyltransferase EpsI